MQRLGPPNPPPGLHPAFQGPKSNTRRQAQPPPPQPPDDDPLKRARPVRGKVIDVDAEEIKLDTEGPTSHRNPPTDSGQPLVIEEEYEPLKYDNRDMSLITLLLSYTLATCAWLSLRMFLPETWSRVPNWVTWLLFTLPLCALPSMQFSAKIDAVYTVTIFGKDTGMRLGPGLCFLFPWPFKTAESPMADQVDTVGEGGKFVLTCKFTNQITKEKNKPEKAVPKTKVTMSLKVHWRICDPYLAQVKMGLQPGDQILWGSDKDGKPGKHKKRLLELILPEVEKTIQTQASDSGIEATDVVSGAHNRAIESKDNIRTLNAVMHRYGVEILRLSPSNPTFERSEDAAAVADVGREPLEKNKEMDDADATMALYEKIYARLIKSGVPPERAEQIAMQQANASQGKIDLTFATLFEKLNLGNLFGKSQPPSEYSGNKNNRKNRKPQTPPTT